MSSADVSLIRDCETAELAAVTSWNEALPYPVRNALGARHRPLGGGLLIHSRPDVLQYNRVLGLGVAQAARESDVDEAIERFRRVSAARFMISVAPGAEPEGLVGWLEARGFYRHNHWIRLARELSEPIPEPSTTLRVSAFGAEHAEAFGRLEAEAFGHPPELAGFSSSLVGRPGWSFAGAFDGDQLVAAGAMHAQGSAAWFGFAATRAEYRGRGAQSALIAARLAAAREAGCRLVALETAADTPEKPNPSTHNLRRLGFRDAYERPNWVKVLREA